MKSLSVLLTLALLAPSFSTLLRAEKGQADSRQLLRELLAEQEVQLGAALADLTKAEDALKKAKHARNVNRGVGIVLSGAGIAGLFVARKLMHPAAPKLSKDLGTAVLEIFVDGALRAGPSIAAGVVVRGASIVAIGGGAFVLVVSGGDVPKWEQAVAERRELVQQALEKVSQTQARLDGASK